MRSRSRHHRSRSRDRRRRLRSERMDSSRPAREHDENSTRRRRSSDRDDRRRDRDRDQHHRREDRRDRRDEMDSRQQNRRPADEMDSRRRRRSPNHRQSHNNHEPRHEDAMDSRLRTQSPSRRSGRDRDQRRSPKRTRKSHSQPRRRGHYFYDTKDSGAVNQGPTKTMDSSSNNDGTVDLTQGSPADKSSGPADDSATHSARTVILTKRPMMYVPVGKKPPSNGEWFCALCDKLNFRHRSVCMVCTRDMNYKPSAEDRAEYERCVGVNPDLVPPRTDKPPTIDEDDIKEPSEGHELDGEMDSPAPVSSVLTPSLSPKSPTPPTTPARKGSKVYNRAMSREEMTVSRSAERPDASPVTPAEQTPRSLDPTHSASESVPEDYDPTAGPVQITSEDERIVLQAQSDSDDENGERFVSVLEPPRRLQSHLLPSARDFTKPWPTWTLADAYIGGVELGVIASDFGPHGSKVDLRKAFRCTITNELVDQDSIDPVTPSDQEATTPEVSPMDSGTPKKEDLPEDPPMDSDPKDDAEQPQSPTKDTGVDAADPMDSGTQLEAEEVASQVVPDDIAQAEAHAVVSDIIEDALTGQDDDTVQED